MTRGVGAGAQHAFFVALLDDAQCFTRIACLQGQLADFHVFGRLGEQAVGQAQALDVQAQALREARFARNAVQQVGPVAGLRIARCQFFQGGHIAGLVVLLQLDVGQHLQARFRVAAARLQFFRRFGVVAADVVGLDQQFAHLWIFAVFQRAFDPGDGVRPVLGAVVHACQRLREFGGFGGAQAAGIDDGFESLDGGAIIAGGSSGRGAHALDLVAFKGGLAADAVSFAQLGQRFLVFAAASEFLRFLQWLAHFGTHGVRGVCQRAQADYGSCCGKTDSGHDEAEMSETKLGHEKVFQ